MTEAKVVQRVSTPLLRKLLTITGSPSIMLAFSNFSRAGSYLLPVPFLYQVSTAAAAFWLLATTLIGMQNLLFLGTPQILVRMLAVANSLAHHGDAEQPVSVGDLSRLMRILFGAAAIINTLAMLILGTWSVAAVAQHINDWSDVWSAWFVIVLSSPLRIVILSRLTFLNGLGEIARPRLNDGLAWIISGMLSALAVLATGSLLVMTLASQLPLVISAWMLTRMANAKGWNAYLHALTTTPIGRIAGQVWPPAWRAGLGSLLSTGARQGAGIMLAQFVSPAQTAGYLLALNGISVMMMLSAAPLQSALHVMSAHFARNDTSAHVRASERARTRSLWITTLLAGGVALAIPLLPFVGWKHAFVDLTTWCLLAAGLMIQRYAAAHLQHYTITNHVTWHWLDGLTGIFNIAFCAILIPLAETKGAALANLLSLLPLYAWLPSRMAVRRFHILWPATDIWSAFIPALALVACLMLAVMAEAALS